MNAPRIHMTGTKYGVTACGVDLCERYPRQNIHGHVAPFHVGITCPQCRATDRFKDWLYPKEEGEANG